MDKIENRDKSNQLGFASTSSLLLKINDFTTNCKEAYAFLNTQWGGRLTVAEVAFLEKELERKKNDDKLAEMFIENWKVSDVYAILPPFYGYFLPRNAIIIA